MYRTLKACLYWLAASAIFFSGASTMADLQDVWIGTSADGIYHVSIDLDSGKLSEPQLAASIRGPGFLAFHPSQPVLYAVANVEGAPSVAGFSISKKDGSSSLTLMNSQPIVDGNGTHLCVDQMGQYLITAQYGAGTVAAFPLAKDGHISARKQLVRHDGGSGVHDRRQDSPHPHWAGVGPNNRFVFVPDLGLDQVVIYRLGEEPLVPHGHVALPPGSGPRHMKFSSDGRYAYVLNELTLTVSVCQYDADEGRLDVVQTTPTLTTTEKEQEDFNSASEIRIHPNQRWLYTANRGHDTITVFHRDLQSGRLTRVETEPIRGSWPRNFNLTSDGKWLIAAGRHSNTLAAFTINPEDGRLRFVTRATVNVPAPICVLPAP